MGEVAGVYAAHSFTAGMTRLAELFSLHPELQGLHAEVDQAGHVDIIAVGEPGVLRSWIHALPTARRERGLFTLHSGPSWEEVLQAPDLDLTVHVRPRGGVL
jgi:hypothetical protein